MTARRELGLALQTDKPVGRYAALARAAEETGFDVVTTFNDLWDRASAGRAFLGLAAGAWLETLGLEPRRPLHTVREAWDVVRRLLTGDTTGFAGEHFTLQPGARLRYELGRGEVPLLVGTWSAGLARFAGAAARELKVGGSANPAVVQVMRERIGERTDQIRARFPAAATGADVLVVQGGINDIVQGRPIEAAAADIRELVRLSKGHGLGVVVADVLPWNRGWPDAEPRIRALNELIRSLAADENVKALPFHDTLEDPARPGRMREEWTADGNHPSVVGYRRLGELAFELP